MATTTLTAENLEQTVTADGITLVDWWATWCGPCQMFGPIFEHASEKHADIRFGKVDTEAERELAVAANIMSIPTLMAFRDGVLVFSQPGAIAEPALEEVIQAVRDRDMTHVRSQLADQTANAGQPS